MEQVNVTPISSAPPQPDPKEQELWNAFGAAAFKLGQITLHIEQTEGHLAKLQKDHELALRAARSAADKHDQYLKDKRQEKMSS